MDMRLVSDEGGVLQVEMAGPVVRSDVRPDLKPFEDLLGPAGYARSVMVSLAEITLIDSICLSWLLILHKRFREAGGTLILHSLRPPVMEILALIRFEHILLIAENEAGALALLEQENPPFSGVERPSQPI